MKAIVAASIFVLGIGCTPVLVHQGVHTLARGSYDVAERRAVWGRALVMFQETNAIISYANIDSGVLASEVQPEWVSCDSITATCDARVGVQFTLGEDGKALLGFRRGLLGQVYYGKKLMSPASVQKLKADADAALAFIVGPNGSVQPRAQPEPATRDRASSGLPKGAKCSQDAQCKTGLACVAGFCAN